MNLNEILELCRLFRANIKLVYQALNDEVLDDSELDALNSISRTSIEGLWLYVPAFLQWFFENYILAQFKIEIQSIIDNNTNLNDRWWANEVRKFQDTDNLIFDEKTFRPAYAVLDEAKQIIKYSSAKTEGGLNTIKVSKAGKVPLSVSELIRFEAFVDDVQPGGANIKVVSLASDKLWSPLTVYYSALKNEADVKLVVEAAVSSFLDNLPYNAEFKISDYVGYVKAAVKDFSPDYYDVVPGDVKVRADSVLTWTNVGRSYVPLSGVIEVDSDHPLSTEIAYQKV